MVINILIFLGVLRVCLLAGTWHNGFYSRCFNHNPQIETLYTIFPAVILIVMGFYSIKLLYITEDSRDGYDLTIKVIGHQWYWSYEYRDIKDLYYDSFLQNKMGKFYLLNSDTHLIIPGQTRIRLVLTSDDVLHAWAIPSFAIKIDVIPGRLNRLYFHRKWVGMFFGQCSEICGINHSLISTTVEVIPTEQFTSWVGIE